jgi:kelch-like protein 2/3
MLYAIGGDENASGAMPSVQAYNPATNSWTITRSARKPSTGLGSGVIDGLLYAVGGRDGRVLHMVEAYDPSTNTWAPKAPMPMARASLAVAVDNGTLFAVGGYNPAKNGGFLNTLEAFTP